MKRDVVVTSQHADIDIPAALVLNLLRNVPLLTHLFCLIVSASYLIDVEITPILSRLWKVVFDGFQALFSSHTVTERYHVSDDPAGKIKEVDYMGYK